MAVATAAAIIGAGAAVGSAVDARNQAKDATASQQRQLEENRAYLESSARQARSDVIPLFDSAQQNLLAGQQGALDVFAQTAPAQMQAFEQGNLGAQNLVSQGFGQFQNAILGLPVDQSAFTPYSNQVDMSQFTMPTLGASQEQPGMFNTALPQTPEQQEAERLGNIQTNQDLFLAASQGLIPGINPQDQDWFGKHYAAITGRSEGLGTNFVTDPLGVNRYLQSEAQGTGFNTQNRRRIDSLLGNYANYINTGA